MASKKPISANNINVTGDFIAGDQYNYYYTGDFASLSEYYISPEPVFQRVRTDDFIGRDWLTAKVDAFLNDPNRKSGAFLLIGDAGVGKTSFMAHLVKERRYLHLFAEQASGQAMLQRAMQSLGSQLVTRYQIDPYKDRDTLNALSVFPDFLERILRLAASTLTEGEKIVIVCDALDEAGTFPDHFVFGLPKELPDGVYFILSQRPVNVKLPNFEPVIEKLEAQGEGNLQDIGAYLSAVAKRPEVAGQIRSKEYSEDFFIQTLKEKSQGVWMYLHYIIKEIEGGARAPLDLANLPTGLVGYYAEYWDAWRTGKRGKGEEAWDELYAPLLTTLAAAQEAIPVDWMMQWADVTAKPREVTRLLTEHWRAFITEKDEDGKKTYTPYHLSFKDFITGRVDTDKLPPAQANLVKDLATQTVDAHKRIVNAFEKECNGEWEKLVEQEYPRLHLTAHLNGAGEYEKLRIILTEGDRKIKWVEAREQKEETYAGYLNDLIYVWDYTEREQNYALAIRCMLIENSIHSLASNIPPELLIQLGKMKLWSYPRCLSTIRENSDSHAQAEALKLIVPDLPLLLHPEALAAAREIKDDSARARALSYLAAYLNDELKAQTIQEALAAARDIKDEDARTFALAALAAYLNDELKADILATARKIKDEYARAHALAALAPHLNDELKAQVLAAAHEIENENARILVLADLAPRLNEKLKAQAIQESLGMAREIEDEYSRTHALATLAPHLNDELKAQAIQESLAAAREIKIETIRSLAILALVPHLNDELKAQAIQESLAAAREIKNESARARALSALAVYLNDKLQAQAIQEEIEAAREIEDEYSRTRALAALAPHLNDKLKAQALEEAHEIKHEHDRAHALAALAPHLNDELKAQAFEEALEIKEEYDRVYALAALVPHLNDELKVRVLKEAHEIKEEYYRSNALVALAPHLNDELKVRALKEAHEIKDKSARVRALTALAPHLNDELKAQVIQEALAAAREFKDESERTRALAALAPHLNDELKAQVIQEALAAAREIKNESLHPLALLALVQPLNDELITQVLAAIREIKGEAPRSLLLAYLASYLNNDLIALALAAAREIKDKSFRTRALAALAEYLNDEMKAEVLATAREIKSASALAALAPYLGNKLQIIVLNDLLLLQGDFESLGKTFKTWGGIEFKGLKENIIPFINLRSQKDRKNGVEVIGALAPALVHFRGPAIADELYRTITDVTRWWP